MAEYSSFFNSYTGDRKYTAAEFVEYFASFIGNGVFWGGDALKVNIKSGMDVQVLTGKGFINGYYYANRDTPKTITIEYAHATMPRIDRAVLRLDLSQAARCIYATVKKGTQSSTPVAPALQRDNAAWELGLADIRINAGVTVIQQSNITDLRLQKDYCGVVAALVNQPDLTSIFNQYQSKFNEVSTHWDTWFAGTKAEWEALKTLYNGWFAQIKAELFAQVNTDFDDWSRQGGYNRKTIFQASGGVSETITNTNNGSVLATRETSFPNDTVKEVLTYTQPALSVTKITSFGSNEVSEAVT